MYHKLKDQKYLSTLNQYYSTGANHPRWVGERARGRRS